NGRVLQLLDGDPAYVRVGIGARDGPEAIPLVVAHLLDRGGAHDRVGMTPPGPESSDQVHGFGSGTPCPFVLREADRSPADNVEPRILSPTPPTPGPLHPARPTSVPARSDRGAPPRIDRARRTPPP